MNDIQLKILVRTIGISCMIFLGVSVLFYNFPIFGMTLKTNSELSPDEGITKINVLGREIEKQIDDYSYFEMKSQGFDNAHISFEFMTSSDDQEISLGYRDRSDWHYKTKPVNVPFLNTISLRQATTTPPFLFIKNPSKYISFEDFLKNPPPDAVGAYITDSLKNDFSISFLPDYQPRGEETVIDIPLRGSHTFYTYLQYEPFTMTITKKDLNWHEGEDTLVARVYKNDVLLTEKQLEDDGITDASRQQLEDQSLDISYQGGYPENGVYKIVIEASGDTVITSIRTNLHRIVFDSPVYPLSVNEDGETKIKPVVLYTDAQKLSFKTLHNESLQKIKVNDDYIQLDTLLEPKIHETEKEYNTIKIPKGDVITTGQGYFSFSKAAFFTPYVFKKITVRNKEDLDDVDYFITDYKKPYNTTGNWKNVDVEFDLKNAYYNKGMLNWIIKTPGLKSSGKELYIRNLEITLHKNPIIGKETRD